MVDTLDLKSNEHYVRGGSSPPPGTKRGNSSVGKARPCQGRGREFESRFPLRNRKEAFASFFYMSYTVYILYSPSTDSYYKGQTSDLEDRIRRHNAGCEKATKHGIPWKLALTIPKESKGEALFLERKLKNLSRERTIQFIQKYKG